MNCLYAERRTLPLHRHDRRSGGPLSWDDGALGIYVECVLSRIVPEKRPSAPESRLPHACRDQMMGSRLLRPNVQLRRTSLSGHNFRSDERMKSSATT
jgi:hypothetical protein